MNRKRRDILPGRSGGHSGKISWFRLCGTEWLGTVSRQIESDLSGRKGNIMEKLWKRLETQMVQSYEGMVKEDSDVTVWNRAFETLAEIVEHSRKKYEDFAQELFILDGSTDFMFDLKVWLDDYMEFLEQEEEQEQLEKVCRKLLKLFAWQKASPSDIRFRLASSMLSLNKKKEAGDFCERWYGEDENDPAAAAALIYAWIADRRYKDAQKVVDFWMDKEGGYTEENAEVFGAAAVLQNIFPGKGKDKVLEV